MNITRSLVELSHEILSEVLKDGDVAVDCTAGNGNDTLFLVKSVGEKGIVYSFDIQDIAIENTSNLIKDAGFFDRIKLIKDSHENIEEYVNSSVKAAIYNLGYLPGGDHNVITRAQSTIKSLEKVIRLLETGGIIVIVIYYGHNGGVEEKEAVLDFASKLDKHDFIVQKIELLNMEKDPPILVYVKKIN